MADTFIISLILDNKYKIDITSIVPKGLFSVRLMPWFVLDSESNGIFTLHEVSSGVIKQNDMSPPYHVTIFDVFFFLLMIGQNANNIGGARFCIAMVFKSY